jgi:PhoPQ-activated pathogenicity-related protein
MILSGTGRPRFTWTVEKNGRIRVETKTAPVSATLWQATNPKSRDFRLETIGAAYHSTPLTSAGGVYEAQIAKPSKGWTAGFVELRFDSGTRYPFVVTTGVAVVPDAVPFPEPPRQALPPTTWRPGSDSTSSSRP